MHSLRSKFVVLALLLVGITQFGSLIATAIIADSDALRQAQSRLSIGEALFNELMRGRSRALVKSVAEMAENLSARADDIDREDWLRTESATVGAGFSLLLNKDGVVIAATNGTWTDTYPDLVSRADKNDIARSSIVANDRFYEVVTVPVFGVVPETWLATGFDIDTALINQFHDRTGLDIAMIGHAGGERRIIAGTAAVEENGEDEILDIAADRTMVDSRPAMINGEQFLVRSRPFLHDTNDIVVLLEAPMSQAFAPYRTLQFMALGVGALALIIALIGAARLSRGILVPLERFRSATLRIGAGDYSIPVNVRRSEELAGLATAINSMQNQIARREDQVVHEARFDRLTDLPNRGNMLQSLQRSIENLRSGQGEISVLVINLSGFSEIRSAFGRPVGDGFLSVAAERLRSTIPPNAILGRLDGDEFMLVMESTDAESAWTAAEAISHMFADDLSSGAINISVTACIGIGNFPVDGDEAEKLLLHAEIACQDASRAPERIAVYRAGTEERYAQRLEILGSLSRAAREDELRLYLQPKVDLADGGICGAEALIRWDHPTLGLLSPQDFVTVAEQSGTVEMISKWVLQAAVRHCRQWIDEGIDLPVSVNLSGFDIVDPDLPQTILDILGANDLDPRYLMLEFTEQALFQNFELAAVVLQRLRGLGIRIAVDDFGKGQASMANLCDLPVDELKIDRSFIEELPEDHKVLAIVRATIELAHDLGIEVLAEGVESRQAMSWLADMGCERAQGFLICRPMPAETFCQWVEHYGSDDRTAYVSVLESISR